MFFALAGASFAEDYAAVQGYVHSFNNGVSVYSGVFALNKDVSLDTTVSFKYAVDLINPDGGEEDDDEGGGGAAGVSGASSAVNGGSDVRNAVTAGFSHNFADIIAVEAYYDYRFEKDYSSSTPTLTLKKDLFDKNTTLKAGYSRNSDAIDGKFMTGEGSRFRRVGRRFHLHFSGCRWRPDIRRPGREWAPPRPAATLPGRHPFRRAYR